MAPAGSADYTAISFPIPLANPLDENHVLIVKTAETKENCDNGTGTAPSVKNPEADPGYLCVFQGQFGNPEEFHEPAEFGNGAGTTGTTISVETGFQGLAMGTWAVTAP